MSSEVPAPTDLTASPVKPPSPSSTNAPIEAVELVEPLEPPGSIFFLHAPGQDLARFRGTRTEKPQEGPLCPEGLRNPFLTSFGNP
jgi:hypothetical protein